MFIIGNVCERKDEVCSLIEDSSLAIEITICVVLTVGLVVTLIVHNRYQDEFFEALYG